LLLIPGWQRRANADRQVERYSPAFELGRKLALFRRLVSFSAMSGGRALFFGITVLLARSLSVYSSCTEFHGSGLPFDNGRLPLATGKLQHRPAMCRARDRQWIAARIVKSFNLTGNSLPFENGMPGKL